MIKSFLLSILLSIPMLRQDVVLNEVTISLLPPNLEDCRLIELVTYYTAETATIDFRIMAVLNSTSEVDIVTDEVSRYEESTYHYAVQIGANYVYHSTPLVRDLETIPTDVAHLRFIVAHGDDFLMLPPKLYTCESGM